MQRPCSLTQSHKAHRQCGKARKQSVSFLWLHSRSAGRICASICVPLMDIGCSLNQKTGAPNRLVTYQSSKHSFPGVLLMIYTPQLTACWGLTALKDRWDVVGLTPGLEATCYLWRRSFLVRPTTVRGMQRAQVCICWVAPRPPRDA